MPVKSRPHTGPARSDAPGTPRMLAPPAGPSVDDWNLLRSFIAVYESGTLTEAAQRLGSTQPNLGRHIRALEALLGEARFVRLPGRLKPTERGHGLHATLLPMKAAVHKLLRVDPGSGAVQMLARVGFATKPSGPTPRRDLASMVRA